MAAQQLFYGHTSDGDLSGLFERWYDTRLGPKKEAQSYTLLAADLQLPAATPCCSSVIPAANWPPPKLQGCKSAAASVLATQKH